MLLQAIPNLLFTPMHLRDAQGAKIAGTNAWKSGLLFKKPVIGLRHGINNQLRGNLPFIIAGMGLAAGSARRGHALSSMTEGMAGIVGGIAGFAFGGTVGSTIGAMVAEKTLGVGLSKGLQALADFGGNHGRLHVGGDFQDSEQAYTMRQVAVQQMSTSALNARRYLGQESAFMHT